MSADENQQVVRATFRVRTMMARGMPQSDAVRQVATEHGLAATALEAGLRDAEARQGPVVAHRTPGPYAWEPRHTNNKLVALLLVTKHRPIAANDPVILAVREDWMGAPDRYEQAARDFDGIVACLNFCEGVGTEQLHPGGLRAMLDANAAAVDAQGQGAQGSQEVVLVRLTNGDSAIFVGDEAVQTSEAGMGDPETPTSFASVLSRLGHDVRQFTMDQPSDEDWQWADVYELLPPHESLERFASEEAEPGAGQVSVHRAPGA